MKKYKFSKKTKIRNIQIKVQKIKKWKTKKTFVRRK